MEKPVFKDAEDLTSTAVAGCCRIKEAQGRHGHKMVRFKKCASHSEAVYGLGRWPVEGGEWERATATDAGVMHDCRNFKLLQRLTG